MQTVTKGKTSPREKITYREGADPGIIPERFPPFPIFRFNPLMRYFTDMDRFFQDFWRAPKAFEYPVWTPEIEAFKRNGEFVVHADLPGLKKSDVKVEIEENTLVLSGERKDEHKEESEQYYRSERSYGSFLRTIPLPTTAETDKIKARFEDGVLEVVIPITEAPSLQRKSIEIK